MRTPKFSLLIAKLLPATFTVALVLGGCTSMDDQDSQPEDVVGQQEGQQEQKSTQQARIQKAPQSEEVASDQSSQSEKIPEGQSSDTSSENSKEQNLVVKYDNPEQKVQQADVQQKPEESASLASEENWGTQAGESKQEVTSNTEANKQPVGSTESIKSAEAPSVTKNEQPSESTLVPKSTVKMDWQGRVWYVRQNGAPIFDGPNGKQIGSLEKGDPVLVTINGEWAEASGRGWISKRSITSAPVGRSKGGSFWK
ncbi:MAG: hypothetical protein HQK54_07330 [Oligoflexales bacterium]|nr:hypothetical protein [Oligoflexales bacterium]